MRGRFGLGPGSWGWAGVVFKLSGVGSGRVPDRALISASAVRGGGRGMGRKEGIVAERRGREAGRVRERDICLKRSGITGTSGSEARRMVERGERTRVMEFDVLMLEEDVVVVFVRLLRELRVDGVRNGQL